MSRRPRPSTSPGEDAGPSTPVERRQAALGVRLRALRRAAGLDQQALAARLGVARTMVSHLEGGRRTPSEAMLERIVTALDLSSEAREELADQIAELAVDVTTLRLLRRGGDRALQRTVAEHEAAASTICCYQPAVIPGLLQTAEYTAAMLATMAPHVDAPAVVGGRKDRQAILYDESRRFRFLVTEPVLRTRVVPVDVLRSQLRRLLALLEGYDHVDIGVIPTGAPLHAWALTGFDVFGDLVVVELLTSQITVRDPREVAAYLSLFTALWADALHGEDAAGLIRGADRWLAKA